MKHFVWLILLFCLLGGCSNQPTPLAPAATAANPTAASAVPTTAPAANPTIASTVPTTASAATLPAGTLFQIVKPDGSLTAFTVDDIKKLPLAQLSVDGKMQEGPRLLDVLAQVGIQDFKEVTFYGSSSPATLTRAQVDGQALLDYANRGTVKLATPALAKDAWTKDINRIVVK